MLDRGAARTLRALRRADGASFTELAEIAGFDPARDLRDADLSGVDFARCDLAGYDFSGANLEGASFRDALIEHAVFARADLTGVRWPHGWIPGPDGRMRRRAAAENLHPRQMEIAKALLEALRKDPPARAVAMLPPGVGRTGILREVLVRLVPEKRFRRALVLTETVAERDQVGSALAAAGLLVADAEAARWDGEIDVGGVLVETFGNLGRARAHLEPGSDGWANPFAVSHLVAMSLPTRRRGEIGMMTKAEGIRVTVAFTDPEALGAGTENLIMRGKLGALLGRVTYRYRVEEAVRDGLLGEAEIVDRTVAIGSLARRAGEPGDRAGAVMEAIGRDTLDELERLKADSACLLIAPDVEIVERLTDFLHDELRWAARDGMAPRPVHALTAKLPRADRQRVARAVGALIITTSQMAEGLDLRRFATVGVLASVNRRLRALLANPPGKTPLRVLDYVGAVTATVEGTGRVGGSAHAPAIAEALRIPGD